MAHDLSAQELTAHWLQLIPAQKPAIRVSSAGSGCKGLDPYCRQTQMEKVTVSEGKSFAELFTQWAEELRFAGGNAHCYFRSGGGSGELTLSNRHFSCSKWFLIQFSHWSFLLLHLRRHGPRQNCNCYHLPY